VCANFIQRLFPLGDRTLFHSPVAEYVVVTRKENFNAFELNADTVVDANTVQDFDPSFSFPQSFKLPYFDAEIPKNSSECPPLAASPSSKRTWWNTFITNS
jgi:hypothetical protein